MVNSGNIIPGWLSRRLVHDDLSKISAAIRQVEVTTSAEIIPMIVRRSTFSGHTFPMATLILFVIYLVAGGPSALGPWRDLDLAVLWTGIDLAILALLGWGLSQMPLLQRALSNGADLEAQVLQRATLEFYAAGLQKTQDATGILLFVSVTERRAVVLADKTIAVKLPPETWNDVLAIIIQGIKAGQLADGMVRALGKCGDLVRPHFPISEGDRNELRDVLIIKD